MWNNGKPYGIKRLWDSAYLCKRCGGLLYYDMVTKEEHCFNIQCQDYPTGIEIYGTEEADLKSLNAQFAEIEKKLGQIVSTCDYRALAWALLERRRRIVQRFFTSGNMNIDNFLLSNDILLFIQKYKSLGIRKDLFTFKVILQLYREYAEHLNLTEDLKECRYLLARKPLGRIFRLKYYDVIVKEIWSSYGLINIDSMPDISAFRYHAVIEQLVKGQGTLTTADYGPLFERLWPLAIGAQYLVKRNYSSSLRYQFLVTANDLANILSIIASLKNNSLTTVPVLNFLRHFVKQPIRDREFTDFIAMLSGAKGNVPIVFRVNDDILLDRQTMLLFFILMHSKHLQSHLDVSGQQRISGHKEEAGREYEKYFRGEFEKLGYSCLPPSTNIAGRDYDVVSFSEPSRKIFLIETKFKDPSPSSLSGRTLIDQEFINEKDGLLPQVIKHQERYELLFQNANLFQQRLGLKQNIKDFTVKAYFITKFTPLISSYGNVLVMSEKKFMAEVFRKIP